MSLLGPDKEDFQPPKMWVVYIAGPFSAPTNWEIKKNVRDAEKLSLEVAKLGLSFICPHKNSEEFFGLITPEYWYDMTMELLRRSDMVLLFGSWSGSKGAVAEYTEAKKLGKPIFSSIEALKRYVDATPAERFQMMEEAANAR